MAFFANFVDYIYKSSWKSLIADMLSIIFLGFVYINGWFVPLLQIALASFSAMIANDTESVNGFIFKHKLSPLIMFYYMAPSYLALCLILRYFQEFCLSTPIAIAVLAYMLIKVVVFTNYYEFVSDTIALEFKKYYLGVKSDLSKNGIRKSFLEITNNILKEHPEMKYFFISFLNSIHEKETIYKNNKVCLLESKKYYRIQFFSDKYLIDKVNEIILGYIKKSL